MEDNIKINYPLEKQVTISFGFGAKPQTEVLQKKYAKWGLNGHNGIDYKVAVGNEVHACDEGIIIQTGINEDFGISVTIKHEWGKSLYAHLCRSYVLKKQIIKKGMVIGLSGKTGYVTGPHLHFGIKPNDADEKNGYDGYIDPTGFFEKPAKPLDTKPTDKIIENSVKKEVVKETPPSAESIDKLANEKLQQLLRDLKTKADAKRKENRDKRLNKIIDHLQKNARITNRQIRSITDVSEMTAINYLRQLVKQQKIERMNKGRNISYILKK